MADSNTAPAAQDGALKKQDLNKLKLTKVELFQKGVTAYRISFDGEGDKEEVTLTPVKPQPLRP